VTLSLTKGLTIACICAQCLIAAHSLAAPPKKPGKGLGGRSSFVEPSISSFDADVIGESGISTDLHDPMVTHNLRRLQERTMLLGDEDNYDDEIGDRAAKKALAVQGSRDFIRLIKQSELRGTYYWIRDLFASFQDSTRYSLQDTGKSMTVSRSKSGEKVIEMNMEFNSKQGLDPQFNIGESFRLRYDFIEERTLFEFGVDF
jgi:hypothetical protein